MKIKERDVKEDIENVEKDEEYYNNFYKQ